MDDANLSSAIHDRSTTSSTSSASSVGGHRVPPSCSATKAASEGHHLAALLDPLAVPPAQPAPPQNLPQSHPVTLVLAARCASPPPHPPEPTVAGLPSARGRDPQRPASRTRTTRPVSCSPEPSSTAPPPSADTRSGMYFTPLTPSRAQHPRVLGPLQGALAGARQLRCPGPGGLRPLGPVPVGDGTFMLSVRPHGTEGLAGVRCGPFIFFP